MPFDVNGIYSLPGGNPVIPGTPIATAWANSTLVDIANALSSTLLRTAGSVAPLNLNSDAEGFRIKIGVEALIDDLEARMLALEAENAASIGSIVMSGHVDGTKYGPNYLLCNGSAVSRTTYSALFAAIGTTWGIGDGATTFNLPDLRGVVPRGLDSGKGYDPGRAFATYQADGLGAHNHTGSADAVGNHTHNLTVNNAPTSSSGAHNHTIVGTALSAGSHTHTITRQSNSSGISTPYIGAGSAPSADVSTNAAGDHTHNISGNTSAQPDHSHTVSIAGTTNSTGNHSHVLTINNTGGAETRAKNVSTTFLIKWK